MGVQFDSDKRFRASLFMHTTCMHLCRNWVVNCVAAKQTKNQKTTYQTNNKQIHFFKTTFMCPRSIAGVPSSQAAALPGYLITASPSVCVPDVLGVLALWIENQKKKQLSLSF